MTEELFRQDAYLKECDAKVLEITPNGIVLDRTVFYPEGGGQPGDRGVIKTADGHEVIIEDTQKLDYGGVEHRCCIDQLAEHFAIGTAVIAQIDWPFRYRHMRTHTCLHLLCALVPHDVTGGSMNQDKGRLDFDMQETVDKEQLASDLNQAIEKAAAVEYQWISDEQMAANMDLVRTMSVAPPMGQGKVRLVNVQQLDLQPCGGTHVRNTAEIGKVRIGKVEKKGKQNRRINIHLED